MLDSIDELRLFAFVFENGSIRAASERLSITAAGGSKRLRALEDRIGRRLFNRTTRRLSPTPDGEQLYRFVRTMLASVDEAERGLSHKTEVSGRLRITASATFAQSYLSKVVSSYTNQYPKVFIDLDLTDRLVDLVAEGIDLAIRYGALADSTLIAQKIASCRRVICASPSYWARHGMPRFPSELAKHPGLIIGSDNCWTLAKAGNQETLRIQSRFISSMGEIVRHMALDGHGVALLADWHVADDLNSGRLVEALKAWSIEPAIGIFAVYPSRENVAPTVRSFIAHLKECLVSDPISASID
jgi:LysR family transcriptional regulator, transcriptional activator for dmlA